MVFETVKKIAKRDANGNVIANEYQNAYSVTINGETSYVPKVAGNRHYDEIMKQVAAGDLTIADAE